MTILSRRDALALVASTIGCSTLPWRQGSPVKKANTTNASVQDVATEPTVEDGFAWHDASNWPIEGKGWSETKLPFDRLPSKAESMVRKPVWDLSRHSSGMMARFATRSTEIKVRYRLTQDNLSMPHMSATGVSGVDLYAANEAGEHRWVNVSRPVRSQVEATLARNIDKLSSGASREFSLYLPLYNGVEKLEVGIPEAFDVAPLTVRPNPIVFYGTSIMHGACASRPGMSISAILGRRLKRPMINLGFSGNGKMERPLADLIGELEPSAIAVDCLPNMNGQLVEERTRPFVERLRELKPKTPILLVEDREFTNAEFFQSRRAHHAACRASLKAAYHQLIQAGLDQLYYLEGEHLLGKDGEGATDGSHPNDLGMMRYANAYQEALTPILNPLPSQ